jgi:hypothetical protein
MNPLARWGIKINSLAGEGLEIEVKWTAVIYGRRTGSQVFTHGVRS